MSDSIFAIASIVAVVGFALLVAHVVTELLFDRDGYWRWRR